MIGDSTPAPTGYEDVYNMHTMDFEEFLWANGFAKEQIDELYFYFNSKKKIPDNIHNVYKNIFLKYICVGGFPKAVKEYTLTHNIMDAYRIVQSIVFDMKTDFGRRKDKNGNPLFKSSEVARIRNVFDLIPSFLSKENKRFVVSKISKGSSAEKVAAIEYLRQAHIAYKVYNLEVPSLPLKGNAISSQFKLFPEDISIVNALYGVETVAAMNKGNLEQGKGAIYESIVFESLNKSGIDTFYFAKESGLEIDFVICYENETYLVEAKYKDGNAKSSKTVMKHPEHYGKTKLIKIGDYNIGFENNVLTIPHYLTFMLGKEKNYKMQI